MKPLSAVHQVSGRWDGKDPPMYRSVMILVTDRLALWAMRATVSPPICRPAAAMTYPPLRPARAEGRQGGRRYHAGQGLAGSPRKTSAAPSRMDLYGQAQPDALWF